MRSDRVCCRLLLAMVAWAAALLPSPARADDLTVRTVESGEWPAAVASLQADVRGEGRVLHVIVQDARGQRAACGRYTLRFDDAGEQAFTILECDPRTQATAVRLARRAALFDHGDIVPTPRTVEVSAVEVRSGAARGGAATPGGSDVACTVAVRPFLRDLEHGTVVYLTPGRFQIRLLGAGAAASVEGGGWLLRGRVDAAMALEYDVVDTRTGRVAVHDRATLSCGAQPLATGGSPYAAPPPVAPQAAPAYAELTVGGSARGTTRGAVDRLAGTCGGAMSGERVVPMVVTRASRVPLLVEADHAAAVYVLPRGARRGLEYGCARSMGPRGAVLDRPLAAGAYDVVVDGVNGAEGDFTLRAEEVSPDAPAEDPSVVGDLTVGSEVHGDTRGAAALYRGSCVGDGAPEQVYRMRLAQRAYVVLDLASDYDGALHLRSSLDDARSELACNDDFGDTRHSRLARELGPGVYYVFVDGYGSGAGSYTLRASGETSDDALATGHLRGRLGLGDTPGLLRPGVSLYAGGCGGAGSEDVYEFTVDRPTFATLRVTGGFEASIAVRRSLDAGAAGEVACQGRGRVAEVSRHLDPGRYYVVVDGGAQGVGGAYTLHAAVEDEGW